jgi:hypothetical protein
MGLKFSLLKLKRSIVQYFNYLFEAEQSSNHPCETKHTLNHLSDADQYC